VSVFLLYIACLYSCFILCVCILALYFVSVFLLCIVFPYSCFLLCVCILALYCVSVLLLYIVCLYYCFILCICIIALYCVSVFLLYLSVMQSAWAILCHLWPVCLYRILPHCLVRGTIWGEKISINSVFWKCVYWFSVQGMSEIFLILKIIQWYFIVFYFYFFIFIVAPCILKIHSLRMTCDM
jgi:hypothetical protein